MNYEASAKRLQALAARVLAAHEVVLGILAQLPIPVTLASYDDGTAAGQHPSLPLMRASELMEWQPAGSLLIAGVRDMITEWLCAHDLTILARDNGPYTWRLDGIDAALGRLQGASLLAEEQLHLHGLGK